jgi:serine protease Do
MNQGRIAICLGSWALMLGVSAAARADDLSAAIRSAVAAIDPGIVTIETIGGAQPLREDGDPRGPREESFRLAEGPTTGVILSADGVIVTSSFNFARDPSVITVVLRDQRRFVAKLLGRDLIRRLALLKIEAPDLSPVRWAPRNEIKVGQYAIACGRGLGGNNTFASIGIVSAVNRRNGNALQTDAKTSPVSYGGPLVDLEGRVLGIVVPMAGAGGSLAGAEWYDSGIGFAIYKSVLDAVYQRLIEGQIIEPGRIGVVLEPEKVDESMSAIEKLIPSHGVRIAVVADPSPAKLANLKVGDKIIALDGMPTGDLLELQRRLSDRAAGETIRVTLNRRGKKWDEKITLARNKDIGLPPERARIGPDQKPTDTQPAD